MLICCLFSFGSWCFCQDFGWFQFCIVYLILYCSLLSLRKLVTSWLISCVDCCDILQYEDESRQEAARKSVPVEELEEKALVSLAKVRSCKFIFQKKILTPSDQLCIKDVPIMLCVNSKPTNSFYCISYYSRNSFTPNLFAFCFNKHLCMGISLSARGSINTAFGTML